MVEESSVEKTVEAEVAAKEDSAKLGSENINDEELKGHTEKETSKASPGEENTNAEEP